MPGKRRESLESANWTGGMNAGLWLEKMLNNDKKSEGHAAHVDVLANAGAPEGYSAFFEAWKGSLEARGAMLADAESLSRVAVGLGIDTVLETGMSLHRTWGVPVLPGAALKGLCASAAAKHLQDPAWRRDGDAFKAVFGTTEEAGGILFYDALPYSQPKFFVPDVLTPHHPKYHETGDAAPAEWDEPTPVAFVSARGKFLVALEFPPGAGTWGQAVMEILRDALMSDGIGAKTSSGYGRFELKWETDADREARGAREKEAARKQVEQALAGVKIKTAETEWKRLKQQLPPEEHAVLAKAFVEKLTRKALKGGPWAEEILTLAAG